MKYSSLRLTIALLDLLTAPLVAYMSAMIFIKGDEFRFMGERVLLIGLALLVVLMAVCVRIEIKVRERYPQYAKDEERYRIYVAVGIVVCTIIEVAIIFAFDFYNFPALIFLLWLMFSLVQAGYNFFLYFRAKRLNLDVKGEV